MMDSNDEFAAAPLLSALRRACSDFATAVEQLDSNQLELELAQLRRSELGLVIHPLERVCFATRDVGEAMSDHVDQFNAGTDELGWAIDHLGRAGMALNEVVDELDPKIGKVVR